PQTASPATQGGRGRRRVFAPVLLACQTASPATQGGRGRRRVFAPVLLACQTASPATQEIVPLLTAGISKVCGRDGALFFGLPGTAGTVFRRAAVGLHPQPLAALASLVLGADIVQPVPLGADVDLLGLHPGKGILGDLLGRLLGPPRRTLVVGLVRRVQGHV